MNVGEVLALIAAYCAQWNNELTIVYELSSIEVNDDSITLCFTDGNTQDIEIKKSDYLKER